MAVRNQARSTLRATAKAAGFAVLLSLVAGADQPTPSPTPLASPVATPQPAGKPAPLPVPPPLSLSECQSILADAMKRIPASGSAAEDPTAQRMLRSVENYLKFRDDLHTSLANYTWKTLKSAKVENKPGEVDRDTFTFDPAVPYISALGFKVSDGDVWLHRVLIYDENKHLRDVHSFENPRLLQQLLPRLEVFHLWRRSTISKIEVEYSRANPGPTEPRVVVLGGMTIEREYIKTAIYHLSAASEALNHHDSKSARESVTYAQREIQSYIGRRQQE